MSSTKSLSSNGSDVLQLMFEVRVISLSWNYAPNASTWIGAVTFATWDEVNMTMHHCLTRNRAIVDANVETQDGGILSEQTRTCLRNKSVTGPCFSSSKVKIMGRMALWDHEHMTLGYRVLVLNHNGETVLK